MMVHAGFHNPLLLLVQRESDILHMALLTTRGLLKQQARLINWLEKLILIRCAGTRIPTLGAPTCQRILKHTWQAKRAAKSGPAS